MSFYLFFISLFSSLLCKGDSNDERRHARARVWVKLKIVDIARPVTCMLLHSVQSHTADDHENTVHHIAISSRY